MKRPQCAFTAVVTHMAFTVQTFTIRQQRIGHLPHRTSFAILQEITQDVWVSASKAYPVDSEVAKG